MPLTALQRANTALDEGDTAGARAALLEAWQNARSPAVADLLGLLDARKPDELVGLLDAVLTPRVSTTLERFSPLARRDDPRVSAFALAALERLPFTTPGAQPLLEAFVRVVLERRDTRLLPRVKVIREGLRTRITRAPVRDALLAELDHAVGLLKNLQLRTSPEIGALEDSLRARFASLAASAQSEEALLAGVYARPADDAPRLVYADWLLERGEERGEFITLQFKRRAGALSEAETRRERQLLKKHGKSWLGALAGAVFWKGLLAHHLRARLHLLGRHHSLRGPEAGAVVDGDRVDDRRAPRRQLARQAGDQGAASGAAQRRSRPHRRHPGGAAKGTDRAGG